MIIYINGFRASAKALKLLNANAKMGKHYITAKIANGVIYYEVY